MKKQKIKIRSIYPELYGGAYPVRSESDVPFFVHADVSAGAKDTAGLSVFLKYRKKGESGWQKAGMCPDVRENRFYGSFNPGGNTGRYEYTVEAVPSKSDDKPATYKILEVIIGPPYERYSAWYEMFHRSMGKTPGRSATFSDMKGRLPEIKRMGFDVLYLVPVHPIGRTNRKGPNNSLTAGPDDPGCPWSIGNETGGHKHVHPALGTIDDFRDFVKECRKFEMEVALDLALSCSPDHPYVREHPDWFFRNPDGTLKPAENPPKKYEDTCPLNFYPGENGAAGAADDVREEMWQEMKSIFVFWIQQGVRIFRIDNPHTKPTEFWRWLINGIRDEYPDTVFLAEAFTYYEKMEELARIGFSQSYTYFTWRNTKNEIIEYFTKLTTSPVKDFMKGNLFTNTPDICPPIIQTGGSPAFKMRIALASTLSSVYGMYNGYELCESDAFPGTETYKNSEKYQYKVWDWDRPGNIKDYIAALNKIRRENPALHYYDNLIFYNSTNDNVIFYGKISPDPGSDEKNNVFVAVNLNPHELQLARLTLPLHKLSVGSGDNFVLEELITQKEYVCNDSEINVRLDPHKEPAYVFRVSSCEKKPVKGSRSGASPLANEHGRVFFELRERANKKDDFSARRELSTLYFNEVAPRVFIGEAYEADYAVQINRIAAEHGFRSIIHAYYTIPGH